MSMVGQERTAAPALSESIQTVLECPACQSRNAAAIGQAAPGWNDEVGGRVFHHPDYEVRRCADCGLFFKTCVLNSLALSEYYSLLPFESFESDTLFPTDRLILQVMNQAPRSKVLDFGCGVGRILGQLTTGHDCYGVEVNGRAAKVAQARGITVIPESALSERTESGFDFVILSDVFEHLPAPFSFLRLLAGALKPGGALIISSGNGDAVLRSEYLAHFWYFRVMGHLQMFSPRNLEWCAGRLGLELTECHRTSHYAAPLKARCRQQIQTWAFEQFHIRPKAWLTGVARWVPGIRRAEHWPLAPALTCTPDHLVAVFRKK